MMSLLLRVGFLSFLLINSILASPILQSLKRSSSEVLEQAKRQRIEMESDVIMDTAEDGNMIATDSGFRNIFVVLINTELYHIPDEDHKRACLVSFDQKTSAIDSHLNLELHGNNLIVTRPKDYGFHYLVYLSSSGGTLEYFVIGGSGEYQLPSSEEILYIVTAKAVEDDLSQILADFLRSGIFRTYPHQIEAMFQIAKYN